MGAPLSVQLNLLNPDAPGPEVDLTRALAALEGAPGSEANPAGMRNRVLERLARGAALGEILELLTRALESEDPGLSASVMLLDAAGAHAHFASAPSLPREYCSLIDGIAIGPTVGSCGTAAYWGERVLVSDIATDPLWGQHREVALANGLRACWSEPINASDGRVLGILSLYYRSIRTPTPAELARMADAANLASIAIERKRADDRISRLTQLYQARSEIGQYIVRGLGEDELLSAVCRVAVEFGGMRMAWIGMHGSDGDVIVPRQSYGEGLDYLDGLVLSVNAGEATGRGPTAQVVRGGNTVIINDISTHPVMGPWRERARAQGFRSCASFPIPLGATRFAALTVYDIRTDAFDVEVIGLLRQIARDVGFALEGIVQVRQARETQEALRRSEQHFRAYFEYSLIGLAATDCNRRWIEVNTTFCAMLGYTREEMLERSWADITHPQDLQANLSDWRTLVDGDAERCEFQKRYLHKDGHAVLASVVAQTVRRADGSLDYIVLLIKDITEHTRTERELQEKSRFLASLLETEPECIALFAADGRVAEMNEAGLRMFGLDCLEHLQEADVLSFILPRYRKAFLEMHKTVLEGENGALELQIRGAEGNIRWLESRATPVRNSDGSVTGALCIMRDVSDKKQSLERIWKQTNFDPLTNLPNRYMFHDRLGQEIKKARRTGTVMALLMIDLDHFKEVNDTLGHEVGDGLLAECARRIQACVRESDTTARIGGDEFAVILPLTTPPLVERTAQDIIARLGEVFTARSERILPSASIGITYYPSDAKNADDLLKNADQAMYVAKREGRNRIGYFTARLQEEAQNRLRLTNDLRVALEVGQFQVHFQPVVDLATQRICGAEALLRWLHPVRGFVSPAEFIPLAEDTGLILPIGDWVLRESARWAQRWSQRWNARAGGHFHLSVNSSPVQFRDATRLLAWLDWLKELDLPGNSLTIEITEGLLLDADEATGNVLRRMHEAGLRVAIDDFGTGYSSLSYLHKFRIDTLKIDQSFTRNLETKASAKALSETIIVMAHKLGLNVVAEGVETAAQRDFLVAAGCDLAQGYLFAKALPPEAFEQLVDADGAGWPQATPGS